MRYVLVHTKGDTFTKEFNDLAAAKKTAWEDWKHLSAHDKKHAEAFYLLESVNPDEEAVNHFDGDLLFNLKNREEMIDKLLDEIIYRAADNWTDEQKADIESYCNDIAYALFGGCDSELIEETLNLYFSFD